MMFYLPLEGRETPTKGQFQYLHFITFGIVLSENSEKKAGTKMSELLYGYIHMFTCHLELHSLMSIQFAITPGS